MKMKDSVLNRTEATYDSPGGLLFVSLAAGVKCLSPSDISLVGLPRPTSPHAPLQPSSPTHQEALLFLSVCKNHTMNRNVKCNSFLKPSVSSE